jgi:hypothetical protein
MASGDRLFTAVRISQFDELVPADPVRLGDSPNAIGHYLQGRDPVPILQ